MTSKKFYIVLLLSIELLKRYCMLQMKKTRDRNSKRIDPYEPKIERLTRPSINETPFKSTLNKNGNYLLDILIILPYDPLK